MHKPPFTPASLTLYAAILLAISMIFSPFLLSVGMWAIVAAGLWEARRITTGQPWRTTFAYSVRVLVRQRAYLAVTLLFWAFALSILWSEDWRFWLERTRIRLPFLVLPWAFANLPQLDLRRYATVIYVMVAALCLFSLGALFNFAIDPVTILSGLGEGQPVPVPRHHIRFSLMIVMAIVAGGWLYGKPAYWQSKWERRIFALALVFLFVAVHIFSVRSALIALYATLGFTIFRFLYRTRQWKIGVIALFFLSAAPVIAYKALPSVQQRIGYMLYDWQHFMSSDGGESYSDSERFVSLDIGLHIWLENKWLGVGIGDLEQATLDKTLQRHPVYAETPKLPHNQFLYILAATGLLGLFISLAALIYPMAQKQYRNFYIFMAFQVIIFISFLVEYTLETSIGAAFFLFYQLWWMRMSEQLK